MQIKKRKVKWYNINSKQTEKLKVYTVISRTTNSAKRYNSPPQNNITDNLKKGREVGTNEQQK